MGESERAGDGDRLPEPSGILAGFRQLEVRPKTQSWAKLYTDAEQRVSISVLSLYRLK